MILILLALLVALGGAKQICRDGQIHTDTESRKVFKCIKRQWQYNGMMLRPRAVVPQKAHISNTCPHNPDLNGTISGFPCSSHHHDHHTLACLNTKIVYICFENKWHIYEIGK